MALALVVSLAVIGLLCPSAQADNETAGVDLTVNVIFSASVTTNDAKGISFWKATLNGRLDGLGSFDSVDVSFKWGTDRGLLDFKTTHPESMSKTKAFKARLWWLSPDTTYYFKAKAQPSDMTDPVYGEVLSFTTKKWWHWWW